LTSRLFRNHHAGFILALKKPLGFSVLNLGAGNPVKLLDFIRVIEEVLGKKAQKNMLSAQPGDVPRTFADISKATRELGYKPQVSLKEGVEKFVQWYRNYYSIDSQ
jgi:UDP-glucuronate 4-epimerase